MKTSTLTLLSGLFVALCLLIVTPVDILAQESETPEAPPARTVAETETAATIMSVLESEGNFTQLIGALEQTGLSQTLQEEGEYTLFAPTDEAFAKLPEGTLAEMSDEDLTNLLKQHLVVETVKAEKAVGLGSVMAASGETLTIEKTEKGAKVNNASIVKSDIMADNGVIHSIDTVLESAMKDTVGAAFDPESPENSDSNDQ
jgi:uncharacterized surface protein with fasciclin (FAS1) repeats